MSETELVVEEEKLRNILPLLGSRIDDEGYPVDIATGKRLESPEGENLKIGEIGYIGYNEEEDEIELVRDDISAIVSYLSDN